MTFKNTLLTTTVLASALAYLNAPASAFETDSMILQGDYVKLGISQDGTLGVGGNAKPGIQYDETGTGTFNDAYDYLTPGSPFYGYNITYNGSAKITANNTNSAVPKGTLTNYNDVEYNGTTADNRVVFEYSNSEVEVKQDIAFDDDDKYVSVTVSMIAKMDMTDVYYGVATDPDVMRESGDSHTTDNYIVTDEYYDFVYAEALESKAVIGFATGDDNANTGVSSGWSQDAKFYYDGGDQVVYSHGDDTIGLGFYWDSISAGETVTFSYSLIFGNNKEDALQVIKNGAKYIADIDTEQESYSTEDLNNGDVSSTFKGGTLKVSTGGTLNVDFEVSDSGGSFDTSGNDIFLDGKLSGTGTLTKKGAGVMTITGSENQVEGGFNVQEGELQLAAGAVLGTGSNKLAVDDGAKLSGSGTIDGDLDVNGTISPGNSPGTMYVNGSVTQSSSSTYIAEIDGVGTGTGAGNYDRLILTGTSSVYTADGTLDIRLRGITGSSDNTYTPEIGSSFYIVTAEGGVTGEYDTIIKPTDGLSDNSRLDVLYNDNTINVYVGAESYAQFAKDTGNTKVFSIAQELDSKREQSGVSTGNPDLDTLYNGLLGLTANQTIDALSQISGSIYMSSVTGARYASRLMRDSILQHANELENGLSSLSYMQDQFGLWARYMGEYAEVDGDGSGNDFASRTGGFVFGLDIPLSEDLIAGVGTGLTSNTTDGGVDGTGTTESYFGWGYLKLHNDPGYATVLAGLSWDYLDADRSVPLSNETYDLTGKTTGYTAYADLELGHEFDLTSKLAERATFKSIYWSPVAGIRGEYTFRKSVDEKGEASVALQQEDYDGFSGRTKLGLKFGGELELGEALLNVSGGAYWLHEFGDGFAPENTASLNGLSWDVLAATPDRDAFQGSLGLDLALTKDVSAQLNASYITSGGSKSGQLHAGVIYKW